RLRRATPSRRRRAFPCGSRTGAGWTVASRGRPASAGAARRAACAARARIPRSRGRSCRRAPAPTPSRSSRAASRSGAPSALQAQGGQYPPHVKDQLDMYGNLVFNVPGLTVERLLEFYKDASFGVRDDDIDRVYSPTSNVTVIRDQSFGVPHIFGDSRYATM